MGKTTDIDIDFAFRNKALDGLKHVPATMITDNGRQKHASGVYFQDIPVDPLDGQAAFDYKTAGDFGFFKVDFLNNSLFEEVKSEEHLQQLLREPEWFVLEFENFVSKLFQIHSHYDIVQLIKPKSVEDLAVVLALIRPGKKHLADKPRNIIDEEIWKPVENGNWFKKSHAIAYALALVMQINMECEKYFQDDIIRFE